MRADRLVGSAGLLEAAPDAIVAIRPNGVIALVNAQSERLFGYGRHGLLGRSIEPATDLQPTPTQEVPRRQLSHGGETVLVVEDEDALREVTRRILARNGYQVLTAAGGPEALKTVEETTVDIDLVITDVIMPHMLGKQLAAQLADLRPRIRVLYMSGYAQPVLASQGTLDVGVTLVEKPFSETALLEKVREVLDT